MKSTCNTCTCSHSSSTNPNLDISRAYSRNEWHFAISQWICYQSVDSFVNIATNALGCWLNKYQHVWQDQKTHIDALLYIGNGSLHGVVDDGQHPIDTRSNRHAAQRCTVPRQESSLCLSYNNDRQHGKNFGISVWHAGIGDTRGCFIQDNIEGTATRSHQRTQRRL